MEEERRRRERKVPQNASYIRTRGQDLVPKLIFSDKHGLFGDAGSQKEIFTLKSKILPLDKIDKTKTRYPHEWWPPQGGLHREVGF